jgi:hypothetical protein
MAAFDIPVTAYTVALVASSHMLSGPAFSVTQDSVLMMWNVVLGVALMLWAFGYTQTRQLLSRTRRKQAQEQGAT